MTYADDLTMAGETTGSHVLVTILYLSIILPLMCLYCSVSKLHAIKHPLYVQCPRACSLFKVSVRAFGRFSENLMFSVFFVV